MHLTHVLTWLLLAEELGQAAGADDLENVDVDQPIWALSESVSGNLALKGEEDDASCCLQEAAAEIADSLLDPQQQPLKKAKITHDSLKGENACKLGCLEHVGKCVGSSLLNPVSVVVHCHACS